MTARTHKQRAETPLTPARLEQLALRYLDRFDATVSKLRGVLKRAIRRSRAASLEADYEALEAHVEQLLARYTVSGVLSDRRFALAQARGLRARGGSSRAIRFKLAQKGVGAGDLQAALDECDRDASEPEYEAALNFARRRRLGPFAPAAERGPKRQKHIAAMARAGFNLDVVRRVIGHAGDDSDVF